MNRRERILDRRSRAAGPRPLPADIEDAVYTAVSEIPDAHPDDIADAVFGMIGGDAFGEHADAIVARIEALR